AGEPGPVNQGRATGPRAPRQLHDKGVAAPMAYWLMKSEPHVYSWDDLVRDGKTDWDGVRNNAARLHLRAMKPGDEAFFYHSNTDKAVVGIMKIAGPQQPDGPDGAWVKVP